MGKRTKQYKRLMRDFEFLGFRQPYQLLMTSDVLLDTLKLDLIHLFEKTLSTKDLKPMITQCCIRALYNKNMGPNRDPAAAGAIDRAKLFERRRCGHLMDQDPLSEFECMMSVVDPKGKGENKFRYIVATQDEELRERLRSVVPTPLMYIRRSVLILEPMAAASAKVRQKEERAKFTAGIVRRPVKRKREGDDESDAAGSGSDDDDEAAADGTGETVTASEEKPKKKSNKSYGKKGPNPLAVKKAKKPETTEERQARKVKEAEAGPPAETKAKRKRRKKTNTTTTDDGGVVSQAGGREETATVTAAIKAPAPTTKN